MPGLYEHLEKSAMGLIVSLPRNDAELARAAAEGGADALKVHLNVRHAASGTLFGSFDEEKDRIAAVLEAAGVPVGVMPGAEEVATPEQMCALRDMGVQFYDIYFHHMPVSYLALKGLVNPATRYDKAPSLLAEAIKDPAMPIREMAIKYIAERKDNARLLAEDIVNPKEQREVKEQAERVFKEITGEDYRFTEAVKRDPNNPKSAIPDLDKEKAAMAQYEEWLKKNK